MNKELKAQVFSTIKQYNMLSTADTVVVGVSGGADSMCLLHFLCTIKEEYKLKIIAAHVNHNLRGDEATADQNFVRDYCSKYGIVFKLLSADIHKLSAESGKGTEECGRDVRYEFFNKLAGSGGKIATAHSLSDVSETLIFNITRGAGLSGLASIPPVRGNIIRPLIAVTREQTEQYCTDNKIHYVTDSSNLTDDYSRNKVRHNVIPVLKSINPSFEKSAEKLTKLSRQLLSYVRSQGEILAAKAKTSNGYDCQILKNADELVLAYAVISIINSAGCKGTEEKHISLIKEIICHSGAVNLPHGCTAVSKQGIFRVYKAQTKSEKYTLQFFGEDKLMIDDKIIYFKTINRDEIDKIAKINKKFLKNALDYDIINSNPIYVRTRHTGDTFKPLGRGVTKTLKKLFNESKIPAECRDGVLVISSGNAVAWVQGFGVSQQCAVTDKTTTALIISTEDDVRGL